MLRNVSAPSFQLSVLLRAHVSDRSTRSIEPVLALLDASQSNYVSGRMETMLNRLRSFWKVSSLSKRFVFDTHANISMLFAFIAIGILVAGGAGIDLGRAYSAKQKLVETAILACQYASRPSISNTSAESNGTSYSTMVATFINATLQQQHFQYQQTNLTPFSYTGATGAASVSLSAAVPTTFSQILKVPSIEISATSNCVGSSSTYVVFEGFENSGCSGGCYYDYPTSIGTPVHSTAYGTTVANPNSTATATVGYVGSGGAQWVIMGYCLEIDAVGQILSTVPEGSHSAELDCDNGSNNAGNSSISTNTYLAAGNYELRYNYGSRVDYVDYDPVYLCGSAASDLSWANDTNASDPGASNALRTNQINVYLDANTSGVPTTHLTMDGSQSLGGTNLIDMCVYSSGWVERSVRIKVTTAGYYWLSFAADGQNDSYGGQLDNIRLCYNTCSGTPQDNFPTSWLAANNGGLNKVLFEDTFDLPAYIADPVNGHYTYKETSLNASYGTGGSLTSGWPTQGCTTKWAYSSPSAAFSAAGTSASSCLGIGWGWATAPYNQTTYALRGADQGTQYIALDDWNSNGNAATNRSVSRPFLLDPGYYQVTYDYISMVDFSGSGLYGTFCSAAPSSGSVFAASYPSNTGAIRYYNSYSANESTNIVGVFMSNGQLISTPAGGAAYASATSFINPNGSVSTTPTTAPDAVTWSAYNASAVNPVLDACRYLDSYRWIARTASIEITKPGVYWLTFSANGGAADGYGGGIDDVKLTALGSPYMSNPPSNPVTAIPVPAPLPSAITNYTGFLIVADPLTAPAPTQ